MTVVSREIPESTPVTPVQESSTIAALSTTLSNEFSETSATNLLSHSEGQPSDSQSYDSESQYLRTSESASSNPPSAASSVLPKKSSYPIVPSMMPPRTHHHPHHISKHYRPRIQPTNRTRSHLKHRHPLKASSPRAPYQKLATPAQHIRTFPRIP
ncbi:unnamed protein product [Anisakis simplex]|uniref:Ovule protein n=1 Tax=Anisakis simplex TaxID=6269 RepID=A0A0M3J2Q4_ANISI|nr:unnamed protein product [Anisakis simplex]